MFTSNRYIKLVLLLSICSSISIGEEDRANLEEKDPNAAWHDEKALARFKELDENGMLKNPISIYSNPKPRTDLYRKTGHVNRVKVWYNIQYEKQKI